MKRKNIFIIAAVLICTANIFATKTVGIIVNKDLYSSIKTALDTYIAGVKAIEGKNVWLNATTFIATNNKTQLKDSLKAHYQSDSLEGAIFIGDLPIANFTNPSDYGGGAATFPCDLYYMDFNGTWSPADNPNSHTGDKNPEIWISRLTTSVLTAKAKKTEAEIVNAYFARVLKRMQGQDTQPRTYVLAGMAWEWSGLEKENIGDLDYATSSISAYKSTADNSTSNNACGDQWEKALIDGKEYGFVYSHSGPTSHSIGFNIDNIYNLTTNCRFYNSYACSNGKYTTANMVGAYATDDNGLLCVGSTKTGSMCPGAYKPYNIALGTTKLSFGESFKTWWIQKGLSNYDYISWHYGMTMQGVGTLHLQPYLATSIKPVGNKQTARFNLIATKSRISFEVPAMKSNSKSRVTIALYTTKGACAKTLLDTELSAGMHSVAINKKVTASGLYICRVKINDLQESVTMVNK